MRKLIEQTASNFAQQGIDVKSTFTPELVKSLMESTRPEAETNVRRSLALISVAQNENIIVEDNELEEKLKDVSNELSSEENIDPQKLKEAVQEDLLQEKIFMWLEKNNEIIEKAPEKTNQVSQESSEKKGSKPKASLKKQETEKTT